MSEAYLRFYLWRTGKATEYKNETIGKLSRRLRDMLRDEGLSEESLSRFSRTGAVAASISDALAQYKIRALTSKAKWSEVVRGKASLPTFRNDMAIPVRCDKPAMHRLEKTADGNVEVNLQICTKPYPRVMLQTGDVGGSARAILDRLLENSEQAMSGYRQRLFEIKQDATNNKWWLYVTYDFPTAARKALDRSIVVGVDLGYSCPIVAAISNGHARMGRRHFQAIGARIRSLQRQTMARRRSMQTGGRLNLSTDTARSGHGRRRKLQPIERLEGLIGRAYSTLNHQLSASIVDFAKQHGAGTIQIEDLTGLKETLRGTFIGARWRYHQLQNYIKYKAEEAGIELRSVNPRYTSRRCSACGHIHVKFDRNFRDANKLGERVTRFKCPECEFECDPDYNAARNLAVLDIEDRIKAQCDLQDIGCSLTSDLDEIAKPLS